MKSKKIIISVVSIVIALIGGFFIGIQYQKSQKVSLGESTLQNGQMMRRFGGQNGQSFRPVRGQVISLDNTSMTVKLQNGNSDIVILVPSTQYVKSASAAASDIKNGDAVVVIGTQNADGSITASDIQINPGTARMMQVPQNQ